MLDSLERPLVGENITFDVSLGSTLSTIKTVTGEDGIARTNVPLGGEGAKVTVHAKSGRAEGNLVVKLPCTNGIVSAIGCPEDSLAQSTAALPTIY